MKTESKTVPVKVGEGLIDGNVLRFGVDSTGRLIWRGFGLGKVAGQGVWVGLRRRVGTRNSTGSSNRSRDILRRRIIEVASRGGGREGRCPEEERRGGEKGLETHWKYKRRDESACDEIRSDGGRFLGLIDDEREDLVHYQSNPKLIREGRLRHHYSVRSV